MDIDDALRLAEVRRNYANNYPDSDAIIALADEVERLRAAEARVQEVCAADRLIRWDDGSCSVSVLDPADILRALDGEG